LSDTIASKLPVSVEERRKFSSLIFSPKVLKDSIVRLSPLRLISNPVMLIVEITFFIVVAMAIDPQGFYPVASINERTFYVEIAIILLITVWFSTLSDSLAETQARMTANSLRTLETEVSSKKVVDGADGTKSIVVPNQRIFEREM
jgi:K+-transporting ATPase ATPase B chain